MSRRPKPPEEQADAAEWMTTYSDMVTLLFAFFVLLFAISQVDAQKFNLLAASLANKGASPEQIMELGLQNTDEVDYEDPRIPLSVSDDIQSSLQEAYETIQTNIIQNNLEENVSVFLGDDYIFIRAVDDMLFDSNSSRIRTQDYKFLDVVGRSLKLIENDVGMIRIDGHTAAVPEQEDYPVSDRELSSDRANAVLQYFEDVIGIRGDKLSAYAFGKYRPIASNEIETERKRNRRIEILVTESNNITSELDNIYEKLME